MPHITVLRRDGGGSGVKLRLSEDLALPPDAITQTFGILAMRGAGKSNTAAVMAEEMFKAGLPFVVVDPVGAWWGLRSSADGGPGLSIPIFGGRHGDVPLEKTGGHLLADTVVDERLSCVLDISELSEGDKTRFLIDFAERLYRRNQDPLHLFLEEADDYAPQRPFREQARLLRAWENVVRRGRARGLGITMITQRSAALNKNVLTQIETLFVLRTSSPQDRKAIGAWVEYHGQAKELLESLPELKAGEAWVWSPQYLKTLKRVQIRLRETFDSGATPKDVKGRRPPATLADVDLGSLQKRMAATIERAKAEDPRELRLRIAKLEGILAQANVQAERIDKKLERIVERRVEVPVLKDAQITRLEKWSAKLTAEAERHGKAMALFWSNFEEIGEALEDVLRAVSGHAPKPVLVPTPYQEPRRSPIPRSAISPQGGNGKDRDAALVPAKQRILDALAFFEGIGLERADKVQLALMVGVSPTSGAYLNNLGSLRSSGLIDYPAPGTACLTEAGRAIADTSSGPRTTEELHEQLRLKLPPAKWKIVENLIVIYPKATSKDALAERLEVSATSGAYLNNLGSLRSLGIIDYPKPGHVVARPVLFLD